MWTQSLEHWVVYCAVLISSHPMNLVTSTFAKLRPTCKQFSQWNQYHKTRQELRKFENCCLEQLNMQLSISLPRVATGKLANFFCRGHAHL